MDLAKDVITGKIVAAADARHDRLYVCRRPGCGGYVYLPNVYVQRPHFRHKPGEGTAECDEYYPGVGSPGPGTGPVPTVEGVEESAAELGLFLTLLDGHWTLGIRLPEIPREELGGSSLESLRHAQVRIYAGQDKAGEVSALDLRSGVGFARCDVLPGPQVFRCEPAGTWPDSINSDRWLLECKGLEALGTLFRFRNGGWARLLANSGVHPGETLLVLADTRYPPPESLLRESYPDVSVGGRAWGVWEIQLPDAKNADIMTWLDRLKHEVLPPPWRIYPVSPPREYGLHGEPTYWLGDSVVIMLEAPTDGAHTSVSLKFGTNSYTTDVAVSQARAAYLELKLRDLGVSRLSIASGRSVSIEFLVVHRPPNPSLFDALAKTSRLRVWVGETVFEAWQSHTSVYRVSANRLPEVSIDMGTECTRATISTWIGGKRRSSSDLDRLNAARKIQSSLLTASHIEVDAGSLGRVLISPLAVNADEAKGLPVDRLHWYERAIGLSAGSLTLDETLTTCRSAGAPPDSCLFNANVVRERLHLRHRRENRGRSR